MRGSRQIQAELSEPFPENELEWRVQQGGFKQEKPWAIVLAYVNNRAIQNRLDAVVGVHNWWNEFKPAPDGGVLCGITINIEGQFITKWDGSENTKVEPVKGGLSDAMKRSAVQWGIGRYLYNLPTTFAIFPEKGRGYIKAKIQNKWVEFNPPMLPDWAKPNSEKGNPVEWAYQHSKIKKICQDMGMNHSEVSDAVFAGNFDELKVEKYLKELQKAEFKEAK